MKEKGENLADSTSKPLITAENKSFLKNCFINKKKILIWVIPLAFLLVLILYGHYPTVN